MKTFVTYTLALAALVGCTQTPDPLEKVGDLRSLPFPADRRTFIRPLAPDSENRLLDVNAAGILWRIESPAPRGLLRVAIDDSRPIEIDLKNLLSSGNMFTAGLFRVPFAQSPGETAGAYTMQLPMGFARGIRIVGTAGDFSGLTTYSLLQKGGVRAFGIGDIDRRAHEKARTALLTPENRTRALSGVRDPLGSAADFPPPDELRLPVVDGLETDVLLKKNAGTIHGFSVTRRIAGDDMILRIYYDNRVAPSVAVSLNLIARTCGPESLPLSALTDGNDPNTVTILWNLPIPHHGPVGVSLEGVNTPRDVFATFAVRSDDEIDPSALYLSASQAHLNDASGPRGLFEIQGTGRFVGGIYSLAGPAAAHGTRMAFTFDADGDTAADLTAAGLRGYSGTWGVTGKTSATALAGATVNREELYAAYRWHVADAFDFDRAFSVHLCAGQFARFDGIFFAYTREPLAVGVPEKSAPASEVVLPADTIPATEIELETFSLERQYVPTAELFDDYTGGPVLVLHHKRSSGPGAALMTFRGPRGFYKLSFWAPTSAGFTRKTIEIDKTPTALNPTGRLGPFTRFTTAPFEHGGGEIKVRHTVDEPLTVIAGAALSVEEREK